ncbi:hypothetical protein ACNSOS_01070 [Aliarcobacter vitoriensis]|uniref:hypothetical protein n=1 Tax=Aliarcobacter vitoriensis TaxID=2011099 RepID=UPI003AAFEFBE
MTNAETISKLNNALSTLIKAYEELQGENEGLKTRINELEEDVFNLELAKEDLEKSVDELKNNTEEDKTHISTMLGQIETILNKSSVNTQNSILSDVNVSSSTTESNLQSVDNLLGISYNETETTNEDEKDEEPNILNTFSNEEKSEDDNRVDLTDPRLNSLLGINQ